MDDLFKQELDKFSREDFVREEIEFHRFWEHYPKKRSKGDAFLAWRGTREMRPQLSTVLKALAVLKVSPDWMKDGGQFIPYPGTWLRAWGWEDVPEVKLADVRPDGKLWWQTASGIEEKARELCIEPWDGRYLGQPETFQQYTKRVRARAEIGNVIPMLKRA